MMKKISRKHIFYALTVVIFISGLIFWASDLTSDPPMYYSGLGQSLSTDPAQYVFHARNKVLFGSFDPFNYPKWVVYEHSLTSFVAYLWFLLVGVSLEHANAVGLILSLGGLIFFLLALMRYHKPWVLMAVALTFIINVTLITYGRLSYLENGLIFISALVFFVFSKWGDKLWGVVLSGTLVACAMIFGKLFGALLLPVLFFTLLFSRKNERWKYALISVGSFIVTSIILVVILYGGNLSAVLGYFGEQSYGLRGFPKGLSSPWGFLEHLVSYGFSNHLFYLDFDLLIMLLWGGFLLSYFFSLKKRLNQLSPVTVLSFFWIIFIVLGLMPLNYSPLRYALFLIPAIIIFCLTMIDQIYGEQTAKTYQLKMKDLIFFFFIVWNALFQIIGILFFFNNIPTGTLTWLTFPVAVILIYFVYRLINRYKIKINGRFLNISLNVLILIIIVTNVYGIRRWFYMEHNKNIIEANEDLEQIVGHDAVISGSYGPALTINTKLKSFIYLFGVARVDSTLFDRYPITHLAIDASNWQKAVEDYPQLKGLLPITSYWVRDYEVKIYNISQAFHNERANNYKETDYEKAAWYFSQKKADSARIILNGFIKNYPNSKSANLLSTALYLQQGNLQQASSVLSRLANYYPTDFSINLKCGRILQILGLQKKDRTLVGLAQKYYKKATIVNPYKANLANQLYFQTMKQFGVKISPATP